MNPETTPAAPAPSGSKLSITLADALVAAGAVIILLFSWARVITFPGIDDLRRLGISGANLPGLSLWSYARPLGIFVILATLLLLASALIDTWWKRDDAKVGLNRHHVQVGLALFVLVDVFGLGMSGGSGATIGWGGILQLLGALIATAGAVLNHFGQLQNALTVPNVTAGSSAPAAGYTAPAPAAPADPAAPTAQMPAQEPPAQ